MKLIRYYLVIGKYDLAAIPILTTSPTATTRGNDLRLQKNRAGYDLRKCLFTNRIVNMWNSLPNDVCMQNLLTHLNPEWINFGLIRK